MNKILDPLKTSSYDYFLPKELIATYPVEPACDAKLLVYDRSNQTIRHTTFRHILEVLPENLSILLNDTKVIKARIFGHKQSGGKVELLFNKPLLNNVFLCLIGGKVKVGTQLLFDNYSHRFFHRFDSYTEAKANDQFGLKPQSVTQNLTLGCFEKI